MKLQTKNKTNRQEGNINIELELNMDLFVSLKCIEVAILASSAKI